MKPCPSLARVVRVQGERGRVLQVVEEVIAQSPATPTDPDSANATPVVIYFSSSGSSRDFNLKCH